MPIRRGDTIRLKSGHIATVIRIGMGDFIGCPYPIYTQHVENGEVVQTIIMSDEISIGEKK